jgi:5'-nucleotidase
VHILISNDDGVGAIGINTLHASLSSFFKTTVVAPLEERSTTGHSLTLDRPLRLMKLSDNVWGCSGFPGDCTLIGLAQVCKDQRPDMVITGINHGANLGQDLYYSGTVAAAREAAFHGVPALATSLVYKRAGEKDHHFKTAAEVALWVAQAGILQLLPSFSLLNLNVPDVPLSELKGIRFTQIGFRYYSEEVHCRVDAREREYFWIAGQLQGFRKDPESDCQAIEDGYAALTPHALISTQEYNFQPIKNAVEKLNAQRFA